MSLLSNPPELGNIIPGLQRLNEAERWQACGAPVKYAHPEVPQGAKPSQQTGTKMAQNRAHRKRKT